jgi:hypothetical protein
MRGRHEEGAAARPSTHTLRAVVLCCCCATALSNGSCSHLSAAPGGATWNAGCPWANGIALGCDHTCTATCPADTRKGTTFTCKHHNADPACTGIWGSPSLRHTGDGNDLHCPCSFDALTQKLTPKDHVVVSGESGGGCVAGGTVASGESCSAECGKGYHKGGGVTQYTCREGLWTPGPINTECTADGSCEATDPDQNAEWVEGCLPRRDEVCSSQCREDYQRRPNDILSLKCTINDTTKVGTWMPVGFNKSADTECVGCWDQQEDKPAPCDCEEHPPADHAVCADMEGGHQAGALNSECKPGCAAGYHHEEKEQSFRCTVVNGTGQWVGGSIECLEGNTDSSGVRPEHAVLITLGVLGVLAIVVYKCLWPRFCAHKSSAPRSLLRESILGSANMPDRQLAAKCARRFHLGCGPF